MRAAAASVCRGSSKPEELIIGTTPAKTPATSTLVFLDDAAVEREGLARLLQHYSDPVVVAAAGISPSGVA